MEFCFCNVFACKFASYLQALCFFWLFFARFRPFFLLSPQTLLVNLIFSRRFTKDQARLQLARWYDKVDNSGFVSFNTIAGTIYEHYEEILN
ncbi:MAG: transposase, partial [Bacteroidaceae bacterium]|nr:transposase [Bacteroidaceae bacterium]